MTDVAKDILEKVGLKADSFKTINLDNLDDPSIDKLKEMLT